jgi:hypothetical protein
MFETPQISENRVSHNLERVRKEQLLRNGRVKALIISTYVAGTVAIAFQKLVTVSCAQWGFRFLVFVAFGYMLRYDEVIVLMYLNLTIEGIAYTY